MSKTIDRRRSSPAPLRAKEVTAIELSALGKTQEEIGKVLGITASGVCKMIQRAEPKIVALLKGKTEQIKAKQTIMLETLYREAVVAWEASKKPATATKTTKGGKNGETTENTVRGQTGDPRYLDQARGCLEDIRKIWGCNTPFVPPGQGANQQFIGQQLQVYLNHDDTRNALATLAGTIPTLDGNGHAGEFGIPSQPRQMVHGSPPGPAESEAVGLGGGGDRAADGVHAAEAREERAMQPVLSGVVAGDAAE